ncbi:MAG: alcohol dehydrogenase catalytic domain-containing protein [Thermotogae bacterium]|nr:alcohol dehydrogenase catalytic domain-containing protein [Thermotogota bacterium]
MRKSRAFVITKPGEFIFKELTIPSTGPEEILIEVKSCGVCTTDRRIYKGQIEVPFPLIGGHEISGKVIEIGSAVRDIEVGSKVAVDAINRCGHCYYCMRGMDNLCVNSKKGRKIDDIFLIAGGFSEYLIAKRKQVFPFPDDVDFTEAAMTEPLSCCINSVKMANISLGDTILVIGAGTMGILNAMVARLRGAEVVISDPDSERRKFANELGFSTVDTNEVLEMTRSANNGLGVDAVFITAPVLAVANESLDYIRKRGTIIFYTSMHPSAKISLDWNKIHYTEAIITGTEGRTIEDFREAIALISNSLIDVKSLVTRTIGLEKLPDELPLSPNGRDQRTVLTFSN